MLYWLADYLAQFVSAFGVFKYLTLRAILGVMTSLSISLLMGPKVIRRLNELQIGQTIRDDGPQSHLTKAGTPTMGGALILMSIFVSTLLWSDLSNRYVWTVLAVTFCLAQWAGWMITARWSTEVLRVCRHGGNICGSR